MAISQWYIRCGSLRSVVRASSAESALLTAIRAENPSSLSKIFYASTVGFREKNPQYGLTEWILSANGMLENESKAVKHKMQFDQSANLPNQPICQTPPPQTDAQLERARYEDYATKAAAQSCHPFTFQEWQPRWGGPTDELTAN